VPFPILLRTTLTTVLHYRADCDYCGTQYGAMTFFLSHQTILSDNFKLILKLK